MQMSFRRRLVTPTLLTVCAVSARLDAQSAPSRSPATSALAPALRVLEPPAGQPLVCRPLDPGATDDPPELRALVVRQYLVGLPAPGAQPAGLPVLPSREITVAWDSTGRPVLLSDNAGQPLGDQTTVFARFHPERRVVGRHVVVAADTARVGAALRSGDPARATDPALTRPPVARDLTAAEGGQARALAAWLWVRRCNGAA